MKETIETPPISTALMDAACDSVRLCSAIQRAQRMAGEICEREIRFTPPNP